MKFVIANLLIVIFLGVGIILQVKSSAESQSLPVASVSAITSGQLRNPAAVEKNINIFPKAITKVKQISSDNELIKNFECFEKDKPIKTNNGSVILSGSHCSKLTKLKITNLSNGYTASVFEVEDKKYKTDLIPLTDGVNNISVEYELNPRKKEIIEKKALFIINREN